jgi:hypothetical protein
MAEMQIKIAADVSSAVSGLDKLSKELDQTGKDAVQLGNAVESAGAKIRTLPNVTGQATSTLTNFSRVVQDAPFGLIGIANNIDPLITSFNQLKATTGTTGGAFKALVGQLAGPAGIALAISTVTSLLITFGDKIFTSGRAAQRAKSDIEDFNKSLDSAKASALSSGLQLQEFVKIAKDGNLPLEQRNEALRRANDLLGKYGEKLTLTNVATKTATELVQKYTEGLIAQALANQLADRAATLLIKQANAQAELTKAREEFNKAQQAFINRPQTTLREQELGKGTQFLIQRDNALKNVKAREQELALVTSDLTNIQKLFNEETKKGLALIKQPPPSQKTAAVEIKSLKIVALPSLLDELDKAIQNIQGQPKIVNIPVEPRIKTVAIDQELNRFVETVNQAFANLQVESFASVGEALGNILGGGDIRSAFQSFGEVIAGGLQAIGRQLIAISGLAKLTREALASLFTNPGLALAAGIGLIAAGAALRASIQGGLQARALGGPVSGGQPYLVGERGPELFVPSVSGGIVPNNSVGSFMSGGRMNGGNGSTTLRGQDIILAYARTQRSQLRVNG